MTTNKFLIASATTLGLMAAPLAPALAQQTTMPSETQTQETDMSDLLTDAKLDSFVDAALEVQDVTESYTPRVQAAGSSEEQQAIAAEASAEIRSAIEDTDGITIEEYVAIGEAAQQNPELAQRITAMAQEKVREQQSDG